MSLSKRLTEAAIERARLYGDVIDSCVLGPDGVVDLREFDDSGVERASTRPAAALTETVGGFVNSIDIADLYHHDAGHRFDLRGRRRSR